MRAFDRARVERELVAEYAGAVRLAVLLVGEEKAAKGVVRFVIGRAVPAWETWSDGEAGETQRRAYFFHHTVLASRRAIAARKGELGDRDVLLGGKPKEADPEYRGPEYRAFLRALRGLPGQQAEAFVLFEVMQLDLRRSATAMDLSTTATSNHLDAARGSLRAISGDRYGAMVDRVRAAAAEVKVDDAPAVPAISGAISRHLWPRRVRRVVKLLVLAAIAAATWWGWRWWNP